MQGYPPAIDGQMPTRPAFPHHEQVYVMGICSSHDDDDDDAMAMKKDRLTEAMRVTTTVYKTLV